jgi:serine/threonine protein kinase
MNTHETLANLLTRWQEEMESGREVPPAELCRDQPELRPALERAVRDLRRLNGLVADLNLADAPTAEKDRPAQSTCDAGPAAAPSLALRACVADYEILASLGQGGMGVVYKARDPELNRVVALKQLRWGADSTPEQRARFKTEAEAVARLAHPHIVQIFRAGEDHGEPFVALEYVPGGSLDQKTRGQPQPPHDAARLVMLLARAVHAAHQAGVVHRDLKPANVLLARLRPGPKSGRAPRRRSPGC